MNPNNKIQNIKEQCPVCHTKMDHITHRSYVCKNCNQSYYEEYICPTCDASLEQIKGCGSVNYLCNKDGLVSSSQVIFHYQALMGE